MARRVARGVRIDGLEEMQDMLGNVMPNQARNILRSTVQGVASDVAKQMRKRAPRDEGTLRKAIKARRRRGTPEEVVSEVRIEHGRRAKNNAWYWHFIEFGTVNRPPVPFIVPTVESIGPRLPSIFREQFGKKYEAALRRIARRNAKR